MNMGMKRILKMELFKYVVSLICNNKKHQKGLQELKNETDIENKILFNNGNNNANRMPFDYQIAFEMKSNYIEQNDEIRDDINENIKHEHINKIINININVIIKQDSIVLLKENEMKQMYGEIFASKNTL